MATSKRPRAAKSTTKSTKTSKKAASEMAKVTTQAIDIQDAIRARAYELFQQRGCGHGYDVDDWLRAESEVLTRFGISAA